MKKKKKRTSGSIHGFGPKINMDEEKYILLVKEIETAILEQDVVAEHFGESKTDQDMIHALEKFIVAIKTTTVEELINQQSDAAAHVDDLQTFIVPRLKRFFEESVEDYTDDEVTGCIRKILSSIKFYKTGAPRSRGYLNFLHDFLGGMGLELQVIREDEVPPPQPSSLSGFNRFRR
jgi:hypothetical protein